MNAPQKFGIGRQQEFVNKTMRSYFRVPSFLCWLVAFQIELKVNIKISKATVNMLVCASRGCRILYVHKRPVRNNSHAYLRSFKTDIPGIFRGWESAGEEGGPRPGDCENLNKLSLGSSQSCAVMLKNVQILSERGSGNSKYFRTLILNNPKRQAS